MPKISSQMTRLGSALSGVELLLGSYILVLPLPRSSTVFTCDLQLAGNVMLNPDGALLSWTPRLDFQFPEVIDTKLPSQAYKTLTLPRKGLT